MSGLTADELYRTAKIPYAFNYIDEDLDVTHDNDAQGDHGTHVAGIATANTYVWTKDADGDLHAARQKKRRGRCGAGCADPDDEGLRQGRRRV